jgi:hypothetical protein
MLAEWTGDTIQPLETRMDTGFGSKNTMKKRYRECYHDGGSTKNPP